MWKKVLFKPVSFSTEMVEMARMEQLGPDPETETLLATFWSKE